MSNHESEDERDYALVTDRFAQLQVPGHLPRDIYAHGTNAVALRSAFQHTDGFLFTGKMLREIGVPIYCGESAGLSEYSQHCIAGINLNYGSRFEGGHLDVAVKYAHNAAEKRCIRLSNAFNWVSNLGHELLKNNDPEYEKLILERLSDIELIIEDFAGMTLQEQEQFEMLSRIPVVIAGYSLANFRAKARRRGINIVTNICGEEPLSCIRASFVGTDSDNVMNVRNLIKNYSDDVPVVSFEQLKRAHLEHLKRIFS